MSIKIVCNQCGTANRLGVIFCKQCGAKLDMESTQQQLKERKEHFNWDDFKHYFGIFRRILGLLLLVAVVLVLVGLFLPAPMPAKPVLEPAEKSELAGRFNRMLAECAGQAKGFEKEHAFTQQELTYLGNQLLGLDKTDNKEVGFALAPEEFSMILLSSQHVKMVLRSRAMKKASIYSTLVGRFIERTDGYHFVPTSAKIGKVSMVGPLKGIVVERYRPLFADISQLPVVAGSAEAIEVYHGGLVIKVRRKQ